MKDTTMIIASRALVCAMALATTAAFADSFKATATTPEAAGQAVLKASKARKEGFTPMVAKKGGSGISMAYRIEGTPEVGKPLTVRLQMQSPVDAQATMNAGEGLKLQGAQQPMLSPAGQSTEHTVVVVPQAEGRFYLNVFSSASGRGSASAIAIQVGKEAAVQSKRAGNVQTMSNGERVISVPAQ